MRKRTTKMRQQVEHFEMGGGGGSGGGDNDDSDYLNSSTTEIDIEKDECKELLIIGANGTANTSNGDDNYNSSKGKGGQYRRLFTSYQRRRRLYATIAMALGFFIVGAVLYATVTTTRGGREGNNGTSYLHTVCIYF